MNISVPVSLASGIQLFADAMDNVLPAAGTATLLKYLQAGGFFMIPLAALSVLTVALIFVYLITLRRGAVVTARYMATADALIRKGDYLGLLAVSNRHNEAIARVMQRLLDFLTRNPRATFSEVKEIAETEGTRQAAALNQQITYLTDIGTIAPMLGLLGTVAGMIRSFSVMGLGEGVSKPMMLAQGIAEALVTTASGLLIAIPAMAAYAFFRGRVQGLVADLEGASAQLISLLSARLRNDLPGQTTEKKSE
ncbi:MAG: MotA/TolQ/ExbB proton channel family protein [Chthoniobacterales bacterium]